VQDVVGSKNRSRGAARCSSWLIWAEVWAVAAVTATVKDELSRLPTGRACCRRAEVSALLRFAGGLYLAAGQVQV